MFEKPWIKALAERKPYEWTYSPSVLWMAVDPAGGGTQSDFAVATLGYESARHVVTNTHNNANTCNILTTKKSSCLIILELTESS